MKSILNIFLLSLFFIAISGCYSSEKTTSLNEDKLVITLSENANQIISVKKGENFDHPTLVIWTEDIEGNYLSTVYITKSYASGIYNHEMVGDSIWLDREGPSYQPAALPYWTYKKGLINDIDIVPTMENPFVDAYTGATPTSSFIIKNKSNIKSGKYRILLEVNQLGDWNGFWTNDRYPESNAYKNSAQPSLVYAVIVDNLTSEYYLNPIGHGDPLGISGKLNTNLSTITTAKGILKDIKITFQN